MKIILCRMEPGQLPTVFSRHRTEHAAFQSIRGRKFQRERKSGVRYFVPCLAVGQPFIAADWADTPPTS